MGRLAIGFLVLAVLLTSCGPSGAARQRTATPTRAVAALPTATPVLPTATTVPPTPTLRPPTAAPLTATPVPPTRTPALPTATATRIVPTAGPLAYPFDKRNMFFGLSAINRPEDRVYAQELGITWVSLQPHVLWFVLESQPGVYVWAPLDLEVKWLQEINLDITMMLHPINIFGEARNQIADQIKQQAKSDSYTDLAATFQAFVRESAEAKQMRLYPHDDTLPIWLRFVKAAVDRYDGDGKNDMPGLKYPARHWHMVQEFPMPEWDSVQAYVDVLKQTYQAIRAEDGAAKVIIAGLAGNYARFFAFADGFIKDPDGGVISGRKLTQQAVAAIPLVQREKAAFEYILKEGKDYFDIADIHLYEEKETFVEGKVEWLKSKMRDFGYQKPIWCIEGGGPHKDPPGKPTKHGDPYFGEWSAKENAEFVVKLQVLSAAKGVQRNHWGLSGAADTDYWNGPWTVMALMTKDRVKKPSYYTFQLMVQKLRDFEGVKDLSFGDVRLIEFAVGSRKVYVAWSSDAKARSYDLSGKIGTGQVNVTTIVTKLQADGKAIGPIQQQATAAAMPLSITPVFLETR